MDKELDFEDCCIKLADDDDFEMELDKLIANKGSSLQQVFDCVKNRIIKVSNFIADYPEKPKHGTGIKWYLKQLLPLTYRSRYAEGGKEIFCVWNMWFGRCFNVESYEVKGEQK